MVVASLMNRLPFKPCSSPIYLCAARVLHEYWYLAAVIQQFILAPGPQRVLCMARFQHVLAHKYTNSHHWHWVAVLPTSL